MLPLAPFRLPHFAGLVVILALAGGTRAWYVYALTDQGAAEPAIHVQGQPPRPALRVLAEGEEMLGQKEPSELANLVHNFEKHQAFAGLAPLSDEEDAKTAHVAPGYFWVLGQLRQYDVLFDETVRWTQVGLGTLAVMCLYFFTRRAFRSEGVAFLTGILAAVYPFWIANTAELADGTMVTFLLCAALMLGTRASQDGGIVASLLFGLALAGLAMTRAALLPFTFVALIWFLATVGKVRMGWFCGLLALLGFGNGVAPWAVRNWQVYGEPIPVATSAYLHLYMGNNSLADGGPLDERQLREAFRDPERLKKILEEKNQAKRYPMLADEILDELQANPAAGVTRRLKAGFNFLVGKQWMTTGKIADTHETGHGVLPTWLGDNTELILQASLLALLVLSFLGWRFTGGWRSYSRLGALAVVWIPLPYILTHAADLSGPRLPLDGVLIAFAAFAIASLFPGVAKDPSQVA